MKAQEYARVGYAIRVCVPQSGIFSDRILTVEAVTAKGVVPRGYEHLVIEHGAYVVVERADHGPYVCVYCEQGIKPFQDAIYDKDGCWHPVCKDAAGKNLVSKSVVLRIEDEAKEYYLRRGFAPVVVIVGVGERAELERLLPSDAVIPPLFPSVSEAREIGGVITSVGVLRIVCDERRLHHLQVLG